MLPWAQLRLPDKAPETPPPGYNILFVLVDQEHFFEKWPFPQPPENRAGARPDLISRYKQARRKIQPQYRFCERRRSMFGIRWLSRIGDFEGASSR
jgi:hypothetical protein